MPLVVKSSGKLYGLNYKPAPGIQGSIIKYFVAIFSMH